MLRLTQDMARVLRLYSGMLTLSSGSSSDCSGPNAEMDFGEVKICCRLYWQSTETWKSSKPNAGPKRKSSQAPKDPKPDSPSRVIQLRSLSLPIKSKIKKVGPDTEFELLSQ